MSSLYAKFKDLGEQDEIMVNQGGQQMLIEQEGEVESIESLEHKKYLIRNNKVVLVDIYGDWCGPCKAIEKKYTQIAQQYSQGGVCAVVKENIDKKISPNVRGVPTFQFYFKGQPAGVITGADIVNVEKRLVQLLQH